MKKEEKTQAREMRKKGEAISDIAEKLNVSKGSVSLWVRDIKLQKAQKEQLTKRGFSKGAIEKRRISRMTKTKAKHLETFQRAKEQAAVLRHDSQWLLGVSLYWGEGAKSSKGNVTVANSDPAIIKIMMQFFREKMKVPESKFRCHVHTFSHKKVLVAEKYWSGITGVPVRQFYKTYTKNSSASKGKKDSLPFGTVALYVSNTEMFWTMMGWIEGLKPLDMCSVPRRLL